MPVEVGDIFFRLAVAIGLGLLVGLQRERATELAGLRTFALITITGFLSGLLAMPLGGWVLGGGLIALAALLVAGNFLLSRRHLADPGITTEAAALAMFATGAYLAVGDTRLAVVIGASIAVLLAFKGEIHGAAEQLTEEDVKAVMQFVLLSLVILPVLPDRTYGPYDVLNPRQVWWMVVLMVGVGLAGYIAGKFIPARASVAVSGLLGGLVSSTAATASYARRFQQGSVTVGVAAAVVAVASAISLLRILVEVAVAAPGLLGTVAPAIITMAVVMLALARLLFREGDTRGAERTLKNPSQVRGASLFALLYASVLFASAAAKHHLGSGALYPLAIVSGLTDVDATTLSSARLFSTGSLAPSDAWRLIVTAALSNLAAKGAFVGVLGGRALLARLTPSYALSALGGLAFLLLS